ncbi:MAG: competence/damage-inducible protein A [Actinomycetota bacterium]
MNAEIVAVGTELLLGQIPNTNAQWISERLAEIGVGVHHHQTVGDNVPRIVEAIRLALARADVAILTGGLGPTQDDVTREAIAEALGRPLERHPELETMLREKFEGFGREMPESNLRQADVPKGARPILPERGTAPGLAIEDGTKRLYAVPGVPAEMREMMHGAIVPELARLGGPSALVSRVVRSTGIGESKVAELLEDLFEESENPTVAFLASAGEVKVRLTASAPTRGEAEVLIRPVADEVAKRLGDVAFTAGDEELEQVVGRALRAKRQRVACAESLTGGGLARRLTTAPGASQYFLGSAVCYSSEAKVSVLGVSRETIDGPGVVSEECAREMAAGARRIFDADVAVSVTGAAGPEPHGGQRPGTVWIALESEERTHARLLRAPGDREQVERWTEQAALDLLRRHLSDLPLE